MSSLLDLLFPRECILCNRGLEGSEEIACATCNAHIEWIAGATCPRCGALAERDSPCSECEGRTFVFEGAVAAGRYLGYLRDLVHRFKFHRQLWLAKPFADRLADRVRREGWTIDAVVPVPARPLKVLLEGRLHGAAETLADRLAAALKRPLLWALTQTRPMERQVTLTREQRAENPKGAYRSKAGVAGKEILLVDDVLTTGATANDCARAMLEAGAKRVRVAVIGR